MANNYNDSIEMLDSGTWPGLAVNIKIGVLQIIENEIASREGRDFCEVAVELIDSPDGCFKASSYDKALNQIVLNTKIFTSHSKVGDNSALTLSIVLKEGRNAYQRQAIEGKIPHDRAEVEKWIANYLPDRFIELFKNSKRHFKQPVIVDVSEFARKTSLAIVGEQGHLKKAAVGAKGKEAKIDAAKRGL
jgi:hypothetical protein